MTQENSLFREEPVFDLLCGYKSGKKIKARYLTVPEIKELKPGQQVKWVDKNGNWRYCKINGKVKLWKRNPDWAVVPCKYGLYESFYAGFHKEWFLNRLIVEVKYEGANLQKETA